MDSGSEFQTVGPKTEKDLLPKIQDRSEELSAERCHESSAFKRDSMDEDQKCKVAYCSDRYTENRDKQFCTES